MVREDAPFFIQDALVVWVQVLLVLLGAGLLAGLLLGIMNRGSVVAGFRALVRQIGESIADLFGIAWRRVYALSKHCVKESLRKRVLLVFVVFAAVFLFAGWFIDTGSREHVKITISFVLTSISFLLLPAMLLLVAWSLPTDIKAKTVHTVVTKPVRRSEVVLGRVVGFSFIGTLILAIMGGVSLAYVYRSTPADDRDNLVAREPVYGSLVFLDEDGQPQATGRNVGHEWEYRSYVGGGTLEKAVWSFTNLPVRRLGEGLPLELTFEVFRTHKGEVERGVYGQLVLVNPATGRKWGDYPFEVKEYQIVSRVVPRNVTDPDTGEQIDIFRDLVHDGSLRIEAQCITPGQFLGMARADLYVKAADGSFIVNFVKGLFGIWLQMFLVVSIAVAASTFLSAPVAGLTTFGIGLCGFFIGFLRDLATGQVEGGGPLEAMIRIWTGENTMVQLEPTFWVKVSQAIDWVFTNVLWAVTFAVPDLAGFNTSEFVANGFSVPGEILGPNTLKTFAYALPTLIIGYMFLKSREIAK